MTRQTKNATTSTTSTTASKWAQAQVPAPAFANQAFASLPLQFSDHCLQTPVDMDVLLEIMQYRRFSGTPGEAAMIDKFIAPLPGIDQDMHGNFWLTIAGNMLPDGTTPKPTTLFSAHTDTVDKRDVTGMKELTYSDTFVAVKGGGVLGSDDGTGIWIMLNLIDQKVPGIYIFHRDEEIGGKGSAYIAEFLSARLEGVQRAIAFDRKGTTNIISYQSCGRCCSDEFVTAFAGQLNATNANDSLFAFEGDNTGTFTDTANYTGIIPECTNLSVGYYAQHSLQECQDLSFATHLVHALLAVDWDALPTVRDPAVEEEDSYLTDWEKWSQSANRTKTLRDDEGGKFNDIWDLVESYPAATATLLMRMGYDAIDLDDALSEILESGNYDDDYDDYDDYDDFLPAGNS
jgi:hypothetical protein